MTRLDQLRPSWAQVRVVAESVPATGAKLAPSFPHNEIPRGAEAQWVSWSGDLVECAIWWGPLATAPGPSALVLRPGQPAIEVTAADAPEDGLGLAITRLEDVGPYLYEVDKALVQARLIAAVTTAARGRELEPGVGYVSGAAAYDVGGTRRYRVVEAMPLKPATLRSWLRRRGITGLTVKQRGVTMAPEQLRRQLGIGRDAGTGAQGILVLTPVAGRPAAIVVEPD